MTIEIAEFRLETQIQTDAGGVEVVGVDLLGPVFCTTAYVQTPLGFKGDGVWRDSPLADFRELADARHANLIDSITADINGGDPDAIAEFEARLFRLCMCSVAYARGWSPYPVWVRLRPAHMSEAQYAIFHMFRLPRSTDPFVGPFQPNADGTCTIKDFEVTVEHGAWQDTRPIDRGDCVELAGYGSRCYPCHIEFDGDTTMIVIPDNAAIQDLHDGRMTVEGWIRADDWGESNNGCVITKEWGAAVGWRVTISPSTGIQILIFCAVQDARTRSGVDIFYPDGLDHHFAFCWNDATYTYPTLWIDGVEQSNETQARNGAVVSDVGNDLYVGNRAGGDRGFDGGISWMRVSDDIRYTRTFTPPPRCAIPEIDGMTVGLWIGAECSGAMPATIDNMEGTAAIDGVLTGGEWCCDCGRYFGNVLPFCGPAFLEFNGVTSIVTVPDAASIRDLHDDAMTVEAWIRADGWGEGNFSGIVSKGFPAPSPAVDVGWRLGITQGSGLVAYVECATRNTWTTSGTGAISPDGEWHHVAFTWDDASFTRPKLWVDGVQYESLFETRLGAIVSDAGDDLIIGNSDLGDRTFVGGIAWVRVSDSIRYSATFTPPERCSLPAVDGNTVLLEIWEGFGVTVFDLSGNRNDGTIDGATWGCDCLDDDESTDRLGELDPDPTCEAEVFLQNMFARSGLTHVFWYDSSLALYGPNLAEAAPPFALLPDPLGINDVLYLGITTDTVNSGPFFSLVFELLQAGAGLTGTWQYWDGAWQAADVEDNTTGLTEAGVHSLHWGIQPTAWTTTTINGVTGWWFRFIVTGVGTIPEQINHSVYTITWPWVEAEADQILGDIPALLEALFYNVSDSLGAVNEPLCYAHRAVLGLRSLRRGLTFVPVINVSANDWTNFADSSPCVTDAHMPAGWTIGDATPAVWSYVANSLSPTGYELRLAAGATAYAEWDIDRTVINDYYGRFHVYVRCHQPAGSAEDYAIKASFVLGSGGFRSETKLAYTASGLDFEVLDLGEIKVGSPDVILPTEDGDEGTFRIDVTGSGASTFSLYDVWLIPVDEWAADLVAPSADVLASLGYMNNEKRYLQVSGTWQTKRKRSIVREIVDDDVASIWLTQSAARPLLQVETLQRYHVFWMRYGTGNVWIAPPWIALSAQAYKVQRYNLLRGSR